MMIIKKFYVAAEDVEIEHVAISQTEAAAFMDVINRHGYHKVAAVKAIMAIRRIGGNYETGNLKDALGICDAVMAHYDWKWVNNS